MRAALRIVAASAAAQLRISSLRLAPGFAPSALALRRRV